MDTVGIPKGATGTAPPPPPRLTRAEAKAQTRDMLLKAARVEFEREGYHGASLERIAARAGFTKGAVYSTFDSKADVMLAVIAARAAKLQEEIEGVFAEVSDPEEAIAEFSQRFARQVAAERDWSAAMIEFIVVVGRDEALRARFAEHRDRHHKAKVDLTRRWQRETRTRLAISPERLTTTAVALNMGLIVESMLAPSEVPEDLYPDAQLALLRGAIADGERKR